MAASFRTYTLTTCGTSRKSSPFRNVQNIFAVSAEKRLFLNAESLPWADFLLLGLGAREGTPCCNIVLQEHSSQMVIRKSSSACNAGLALLVVAIVGFDSSSAAHNRISQVTWTTDVEPIMKARCLGCHTPGGFGPMSLETYQEARTWAKAIREEVLERRMPPWPAARGFGEFINDRSLTPLEIELLTAWADGATPIAYLWARTIRCEGAGCGSRAFLTARTACGGSGEWWSRPSCRCAGR